MSSLNAQSVAEPDNRVMLSESGTRLGTMFSIAIAMAATIVGVLLFSVVMGTVLSQQRVVSVVREAVANHDFRGDVEPEKDFFTECALLQSQYFGAAGSVLTNAFHSEVAIPPGMDICEALGLLAEGRGSGFTAANTDNYLYGARFLDAPFLAFLGYRQTGATYRVISYAAVVLLLLAMMWRDWRVGLLLAPIPIVLLYAFGLQRYGESLSHAPTFFVGTLAVALWVSMPKWLQQRPQRYAFYGAVSIVNAYFDLLTGSTAFLFGLTLIVAYFFSQRPELESKGSLAIVLREAAVIALCLIIGYGLLSLAHLLLLELLGYADLAKFSGDLLSRLSSTVGGTFVDASTLVASLWSVCAGN
jgi:hypothetical protein